MENSRKKKERKGGEESKVDGWKWADQKNIFLVATKYECFRTFSNARKNNFEVRTFGPSRGTSEKTSKERGKKLGERWGVSKNPQTDNRKCIEKSTGVKGNRLGRQQGLNVIQGEVVQRKTKKKRWETKGAEKYPFCCEFVEKRRLS